MNRAVEQMLERYDCSSVEDYALALQEIIQEIALLGLWRTKFFEHAAFYGGTALRVLYGLDRFSEDLDFSLLAPNADFSLAKYFEGVKDELSAYGFKVEISQKTKSSQAIESAFIKANSLEHLLLIGYAGNYHPNGVLKIKFEVDREPPQKFNTEAKTVFLPTPFAIKTFTPPNLFAGKMHALLFRNWKGKVKGRDWYDFVWYVGQGIPLNLTHFNERYMQSEKVSVGLTQSELLGLLQEKIEELRIDRAQDDVRPFIKDGTALELWSAEFFREVARRMTIE